MTENYQVLHNLFIVGYKVIRHFYSAEFEKSLNGMIQWKSYGFFGDIICYID